MTYKGYEIRLERAGWIQWEIDDNGCRNRVVGTIEDYDSEWYIIIRDGKSTSHGIVASLDEAKQLIDEEVYRNSVKVDGHPVTLVIRGQHA
jgi:hypothetical protein